MKDYEEIISTLLARIADLEAIVRAQAIEIAELKKRPNKNSGNSSKPRQFNMEMVFVVGLYITKTNTLFLKIEFNNCLWICTVCPYQQHPLPILIK